MDVQKVFAVIVAILVIWVMIPHVKRGEYIAPNPIAPNTWMAQYVDSDMARAMATPPQGYGFRHYDFWNETPISGRPATREDFRLRW